MRITSLIGLIISLILLVKLFNQKYAAIAFRGYYISVKCIIIYVDMFIYKSIWIIFIMCILEMRFFSFISLLSQKFHIRVPKQFCHETEIPIPKICTRKLLILFENCFKNNFFYLKNSSSVKISIDSKYSLIYNT